MLYSTSSQGDRGRYQWWVTWFHAAILITGAGDCFCAAAIYAMAKFQRDEKVIDIKSVLKFAVDLARYVKIDSSDYDVDTEDKSVLR